MNAVRDGDRVGARRKGVWLAAFAALVVVMMGAAPRTGRAQVDSGAVALAYVWRDTLTLADVNGEPLAQPGLAFDYGQGARLFWTADARTLYIARDDGLYATGPGGAAPVQVPGRYGRTLTISQDRETMYYLETSAPEEVENSGGLIAFPLRELSVRMLSGGQGRLAGYFGRFQPGASRADLSFAGALYVRDGGLLGPGRPNLWTAYGAVVLGTCCFPDPGLGRYDIHAEAFTVQDDTFLPGAAARNLTGTHLAGPTTDGRIRVIDLITGGARDYTVEIAGGLGVIERMAWSPDDAALYFVSRYAPSNPLALAVDPPFPVDTRSANIQLYRLNLVSGTIRELAWRADVYGVSSLAATDRYVFATIVEPNRALVEALNAGRVPAGAQPTDPALAAYLPATQLWRVDVETGAPVDVRADVWGLAARPLRG
ncbi:MAG TPA: hypothetical protein PKD46_16275 [Aggregatilineaceae bacterium]|nr:hypothetical protein [Aggregatilineaceae bacterium]